jgi:polyisoprenoid-binding protein YceI
MTWTIDSATSQMQFHARMRLMFVSKITVVGQFSEFQGSVTGSESDPANVQANVTINAASLDTKSAPRDKHLRSADFFDVDHYPQLTFSSRRIEALDAQGGHYRVSGLLTIRDVAREVSLDARTVPQAQGERRRALDLETTVDRRDFGLVWSSAMQRIADDVRLTLHVELVPVDSAS